MNSHSQNPEGSSSLTNATPDTDRRRLPRLMLSQEQFRLKTNGKVFSVTNLSESGFALRILDPADAILFTVGVHIQGEFKSQDERLVVKAQVRHVFMNADGGQIGLEFENNSREFDSFLKARLTPSRLGAALRPMPSPGDYSLWFQGPVGTDLLVDVNELGKLLRFAFYTGETTVLFENETIRSGNLNSTPCQEEHRGVVCWNTHEVQVDKALDLEKVRIAKEVILSSKLSQELHRQFQALLNPS